MYIDVYILIYIHIFIIDRMHNRVEKYTNGEKANTKLSVQTLTSTNLSMSKEELLSYSVSTPCPRLTIS